MVLSRIPTETQKEIIYRKKGLFTVRACPGSGKTFTVAARLNRLLLGWGAKHQGIATISFTNVAWEEIQEYLVKEFGHPQVISYPHFLGTIDSFINRYIFLPFGYLLMECDSRPNLIGPPHNDYEPVGNKGIRPWPYQECNKQCNLNDFSYDHDKTLINRKYRSLGDKCTKVPEHPCAKEKRSFIKKGLATQADANYFALRILQKYPNVTKGLGIRFPMMMVDEAQDTSRIQMMILELLVENGLNEMMLVGDPDQAIYEWREAEPRLFAEKCSAWKDNSIELSENWRSSQFICNFANRFSSASNSNKMKAVNPLLRECSTQVEIWPYKAVGELPTLYERFEKHCTTKIGISFSESGILARGTEFLNSIRPGSAPQHNINPWKDSLSRALAEARYLLDRGGFRDALRTAERELVKQRSGATIFHAEDLEAIHGKIGFSNWRSGVFGLLNQLPMSDVNLSTWISHANCLLAHIKHFPEATLQVKRNSAKCRYGDLTFEEVFGTPKRLSDSQSCHIGTVHSVKGRTLEGVMLVLKQKAGKGGNYINILDNDIVEDEELRILYVAITRPQKVLVLVVPEKDERKWREHILPL